MAKRSVELRIATASEDIMESEDVTESHSSSEEQSGGTGSPPSKAREG
jgi:hypothetical protein